MKNRFKFRFWFKDTQEMIYSEKFNDVQTLGQWLFGDRKDVVKMQCTGLKDKNGKLIYEGYILGGTFENLYVHYCDDCKQFQLKANDYGCLACEGDIHWYEIVEAEEQNELEVIGNIYENKELLNEI